MVPGESSEPGKEVEKGVGGRVTVVVVVVVVRVSGVPVVAVGVVGVQKVPPGPEVPVAARTVLSVFHRKSSVGAGDEETFRHHPGPYRPDPSVVLVPDLGP